jgi:predicted RNA polymerase sigma factor
MPSATAEAIDAVWRIESGRLIAGLTRVVGDVTTAEDLACENERELLLTRARQTGE